MKNLFKLLIIIPMLSISTQVFAEDEIRFFESNSTHTDSDPGTGRELDNDDYSAAPINDYIPLLITGGLILGLLSRNKKQHLN